MQQNEHARSTSGDNALPTFKVNSSKGPELVKKKQDIMTWLILNTQRLQWANCWCSS